MNDLQELIRAYTSRPGYKPLKPAALAKKLKITKRDLPDFKTALEAVMAAGTLRVNKNGLLRPQAAPGLVTGTIKRISSGAGYVVPHERTEAQQVDRSADIYIDAKDMRDAHTGDEVLVRLSNRRRSGGQRSGRIEEVLTRATNTFVGTYFEKEEQGFVQVDGKIFTDPILVGDPGAKGAQSGDKVVIEMLRFPMHTLPGEAVLTKVLGPRGEPGVDTLSIIHEFGLPDEFPEEALEEARIQADQFDEDDLGGRLDLTRDTIVTIDPVDARDFDDAISLTRSDDGHWHLGVHIADVSHFVTEGSPLDQEAYQRGTSVYLPTRVLPMLPEVISNGLASLQAGRMRYAKSVFIEFGPDGVPIHTRFANSAIKVTKRFAYEEVLPIIQDPERFRTRVSAKVRALLGRMHELAMILRKRRFKGGALELSLREVKLDFDKEGRVAGAHEVEHDESHQIIEEFMLAANIAVATELADRGVPFLRRIHGDPNEIKLRAFAQFVTALGFPLKRYQSRPDLQALLNQVKGEPTEHAVNFAFLRSMRQAEYAGIDMGHYALAEEDYCHFTSPIRRYPDLMVHRLIDQLVAGTKKPRGPHDLDLARAGKHCSATERRAQDAERELTKVKLLTYMKERVGDEMDAIITGVEQFGLFCQGIEIPVEGLVHISALDQNDYFYYDAGTFSLIARGSGKTYRLGDRVRVRIAHVDVDRRVLDMAIAGRGDPKKRAGNHRPQTSGGRPGPHSGKRRPKSEQDTFEPRRPKRGKKGSRGRRR